MRSSLRTAELAVAALLSLAAIYLHLLTAISAGGLWRDEANTVGLATLPSLRDVAENLQFDSFPILWLVVVRTFAAVAGVMNDPAFRALGFAIGVVIIGLLWYTARGFSDSPPLVSLAILALCPSLIVWGDSMRAYGFGIALILLTAALLWRFVDNPSHKFFFAALIAALASVHALFYNSVLLLAFGAGAIAVCVVRRAWMTAGRVILIGVVCAASMLPYVAEIRRARNWNELVQMPDYNLAWFWLKLEETVKPAGRWALAAWLFLALVSVIGGGAAVIRRRSLGLSSRQRDAALYALVVVLIGVPALMIFLDRLSYYTQPWYYLTLLVVVAVCADAIIGVLARQTVDRVALVAAAFTVGAITIIPGSRFLQTRHTNADLISDQLMTLARPNDLVLVSPWENGVSFERYYRGPARWQTVPAIEFHRFHRYDLLKQLMMEPDQVAPVRGNLADIKAALQAGMRVFVVGYMPATPRGEKPQVLLPAPLRDRPWPSDQYADQWSALVGYFLTQHATRFESVTIKTPLTISMYEAMPVMVAEGWRP